MGRWGHSREFRREIWGSDGGTMERFVTWILGVDCMLLGLMDRHLLFDRGTDSPLSTNVYLQSDPVVFSLYVNGNSAGCRSHVLWSMWIDEIPELAYKTALTLCECGIFLPFFRCSSGPQFKDIGSSEE